MGSRDALNTSVLVPFWIIRTVLMLVLFCLYVIFLALFLAGKDVASNNGITLSSKQRGEGVGIPSGFIALTLICYIIDIASIILHLTHRLSAKIFLILCSVQTAAWSAATILTIITDAKSSPALAEAKSSALLAFTVIVYALFLGILTYAIKTFRRERMEQDSKFGNYEKTQMAENLPRMPSPHNFTSGAQQRESTTSSNV